ncbi:SAM-dependent methyltransferase ['Fragaria x ananassa' phyllody phytoplasma]|uniref:SAM-dependent methyltransferase n=1 Tax='Fragaria x ananassa' phyllody phytoplasma TaxID=2358428 RepID=A0ABS5K2Z4_9MOLU|nr:class I SAM-dependent methyltransferase ['Fragaria x ananassa' phyllody phytoplasma]MBS2126222.1 SAM-dependent methyltransferase ['Fragaria x ananassa' phyllody phytoplasma]
MKRISFIASLTKNYSTVLDIGTDHGLVLKKAFQKGYIKKALASDIRIKPLLQCQKNLQNYPVTFYLSNGFNKIDQDFDLALICGMGTYTIIKILSQTPDKSKHFLLGTQSKLDYLKTWLLQNDFVILEEYNLFDKFFYSFLKITGKILK